QAARRDMRPEDGARGQKRPGIGVDGFRRCRLGLDLDDDFSSWAAADETEQAARGKGTEPPTRTRAHETRLLRRGADTGTSVRERFKGQRHPEEPRADGRFRARYQWKCEAGYRDQG